ncbi:MAG: S10 family peptidase [Steroidobacterales bacterium]
MKPRILGALSALLVLVAYSALPAAKEKEAAEPDAKAEAKPDENETPKHLKDEKQVTQGSVTIGGRKLGYQAEAGVLVIHVTDPTDLDPVNPEDKAAQATVQVPEASMSYVAYFQGDKESPQRPIMFIFNGGPGSSTVWLHMGAFGPKRVLTPGDTHGPAAPYRIVDNEYSLLDVSDLVFVDAPGTGFSHLRGKDKEKAFFGVDPDAHAFASFIAEFLGRHGRWNSPKYVFGESYGTTRGAALAYVLQNEKYIDLNGLIFLSQILDFDNSPDAPQTNPGVNQPYVLSLPTYAATAWYHRKIANAPATLEPFLAEVEQFATGDYAQALAAGGKLTGERKHEIATRMHDYIGLPVDYLERSNLRVNGGQFEKTLLGDEVTTGRLDTRFSGPTIDPMSREASYDPQTAAIVGAYVAAFNDYVRKTLKFGEGKTYKPYQGLWNDSEFFLHQPPGLPYRAPQAVNVMPDLAYAMQQNPNLKVQMHGGYYDLATPFFAAQYELEQLPMQANLQKNIEMHFYESGHMVYALEAQLKALHANVAAFVDATKVGSPP